MRSTTGHRALVNVEDSFLPLLLENQGFQDDIEAALTETDRWQRRTRALVSNVVLVFVLLMSLKRSSSISNLLKELMIMLREVAPDLSIKAVTDEAMIKRRAWLGVEPLRVLFEKRSSSISPSPSFHGLRPWVVDGVRFLVPDTPENVAEFGRPKASRGRTAFPQMLGVGLLDATTRQVRDMAFAPCTAGEREASMKLLDHLNEEDLLLADRGFAAAWWFEELLKRKVHFLTRVPMSWKPTIERRLADGDYIALVQGRAQQDPEEQRRTGRKTRTIQVRARIIEYKIGRNQRVRLATDLLDPKAFPALELARYYHNRWEVELAFDEIKVHLSTVTHGTLHTTFRSKRPGGAIQEAYALLIVYNLLRDLMDEAGKRHGIDPLNISFLGTVEIVRHVFVQHITAQPQPLAFLDLLLKDISTCLNPRPRRKRRSPRVVKIKMSNWKLRRPQHRSRPYDPESQIRLARRYTRSRSKSRKAA